MMGTNSGFVLTFEGVNVSEGLQWLEHPKLPPTQGDLAPVRDRHQAEATWNSFAEVTNIVEKSLMRYHSFLRPVR